MTNQLQTWDDLSGDEVEELFEPDLTQEEEEVAVEPQKPVATQSKPIEQPKTLDLHPTESSTLSREHELIAQAMLMTRGDLGKASRLDSVDHNAMSLRAVVKKHPPIRARYHELLADEMQEKGLHIAERILRMAELQEKAMGQTILVEGPDGMEEMDIPADPKMVIELSKEISRLFAEGKQQNMSAKSTVILASKEDAKELLAQFLDS